MYYTYVIRSKKDERWYTGSTNDLRPDKSGLSLTGFTLLEIEGKYYVL
jgi:hypothetical protein